MKRLLFLLLIVVLFNSCRTKQTENGVLSENQDHLILSVLWFQRSPEMEALFYQCYNNASKSLDEKLRQSDNKSPKAVIMDIDETILDNSPLEAYQVINNIAYSDTLWRRWTDLAIAEPLPGALEFINYAKSAGVEVFYVSNRSELTAHESTLANLRKWGFPFADSLHLILKTTISSKEERRKSIASKYDILLYIGDNLGDFDQIFDNRDDNLGLEAVKQNKMNFGDKYIVLPNPMYGPWINAAMKKSQGSTSQEKLLNSIISF